MPGCLAYNRAASLCFHSDALGILLKIPYKLPVHFPLANSDNLTGIALDGTPCAPSLWSRLSKTDKGNAGGE